MGKSYASEFESERERNIYLAHTINPQIVIKTQFYKNSRSRSSHDRSLQNASKNYTYKNHVVTNVQ